MGLCGGADGLIYYLSFKTGRSGGSGPTAPGHGSGTPVYGYSPSVGHPSRAPAR